ncbi:MAG: class I SAM-dependent methyltransferase [Chthoniobacteraceae bacterium]
MQTPSLSPCASTRPFSMDNTLSKILNLAARLPRILSNPRLLRKITGTALGMSDEVMIPGCDLTRFPSIGLIGLIAECPEQTRVTLALFPKFPCSISPLEAFSLAVLLAKSRAKRVFEFGTYLGISTSQLALNIGDDGHVFTLDLPEDDPRVKLTIDDPTEMDLTSMRDKGRLIPADMQPKVTFIRQDSASFDETPYLGSMDLVFVDGAHSADYVSNDSTKGWRMLKQGGIIVWHDCCPQDPDVVRFLLASPYQPKRIDNTSLAFAEKR